MKTEFLASAGVFCASYSQLALFLRLGNGVIWRGPNLGKTPSAPSPRSWLKTVTLFIIVLILTKCSFHHLFPWYNDICISYLKTLENPLENSLVPKKTSKSRWFYKWRQGRKTFAVEAGSPGSPWVWVVFHVAALKTNYGLLLLMAEILHQLIGSVSDYLQGFIYTSQVVQDFFHQQYHWSFLTFDLIAYSKLTQSIHSPIYQCTCTVPIKNISMSTYLPILICSPNPLWQTKSVSYY